ncbi:hypothetical protein LEP3755_12070 [Leptolyngbya sp. NIES-3755]|nr:hypothetical protein LEP3755_12070 [Leptolyngbya sp. NIES-3755]
MTAQLQTQKKAPSVAPVQQSFQPRAFPALQAKEDESLSEQTELHTQLDRAEQFGHSFGNLQTHAAPTTAVQAKADPIQREAAGGGIMEMLMPMIMQLLPTILPMLIGLI